MNGGKPIKDNTTTYIIIGFVVVILLIAGGVGIWWYLKKDITVTVTVNPSNVGVEINTTRTFNATVSEKSNKTINKDVTWSVSDTSLGSIDQKTGVFTALKSSGSVTITATSVGDSSKSGTATVNLLPTKETFINFLSTFGIITKDKPLYSSDGAYYATTQPDGKLCVKYKNGNEKWCNETQSKKTDNFTVMQSDGNLCTYTGTDLNNRGPASMWCSDKFDKNSKDNYVIMQNDGKLCTHKGKNPSDDKGELWCSI